MPTSPNKSARGNVVGQARPERGHVGHGALFRLRMGVECVQAHTLMFHVIPKQERVGTIGDGVNRGPRAKILDFRLGLHPGYPSLMGLGGANVQMRALLAHI